MDTVEELYHLAELYEAQGSVCSTPAQAVIFAAKEIRRLRGEDTLGSMSMPPETFCDCE